MQRQQALGPREGISFQGSDGSSRPIPVNLLDSAPSICTGKPQDGVESDTPHSWKDSSLGLFHFFLKLFILPGECPLSFPLPGEAPSSFVVQCDQHLHQENRRDPWRSPHLVLWYMRVYTKGSPLLTKVQQGLY